MIYGIVLYKMESTEERLIKEHFYMGFEPGPVASLHSQEGYSQHI